MARRLFAWTLVGLFLCGCSQSPQPKAKRGDTDAADADKLAKMLNPHGTNNPVLDNQPLDDSGGEVRLEGLALTAPKGWGRKQPQSSFIQAEFVLPKTEGDNLDGRLTLSVAGGSIEANIDRWKDQFGGTPTKTAKEQFDANGLKITLVDFSGDFNDQRGPGAPAVKRSGQRMIAAIIPANGALHFVKGVGPEKTMEAHAEKIRTFVRSAKPSN